MVAIFEQSGLSPLERTFRPRAEPRDPPEIFGDRAFRFDFLGAANRNRTVKASPRATDQTYRDERERRNRGAESWDDSQPRGYEAPPARSELPFMATRDELALRSTFGFRNLGEQRGGFGLLGADEGSPSTLGSNDPAGGGAFGRLGITGARDDGFGLLGADLGGGHGDAPRVGSSSDGGFGLLGTRGPAGGSGRVLDDGAVVPAGPQDPSYRFFHGRQTGYGAGRSIQGAQSYYTPYGGQQGYPDYVERTSSSVYGGTAIVRLSPMGVFLSEGGAPSAFGLA